MGIGIPIQKIGIRCNCGQEIGARMNAASLLEYVLASSDDRLNPVRQSLYGTKPAVLEITQGDGEPLLDITAVQIS